MKQDSSKTHIPDFPVCHLKTLKVKHAYLERLLDRRNKIRDLKCRVGDSHPLNLCARAHTHTHAHTHAHTHTHTHTHTPFPEVLPNYLAQCTLKGLTYYPPEQWFSKYGPHNNSISLTWELLRNIYHSPQSQPMEAENLCFNETSR